MMLLKVENIFLKYSQTDDWLIEDLNFCADRNEIILMKGKNGSGKTSLLSMFCGIIPKAKKGIMGGKIFIAGIDISSLSLPELSPLISMVFQDPEKQLSFPQVVHELAFGPENLKLPVREIHRKIEYISDLLGIDDLLKSDTATLSYGQKMLVAIASVFTLSPDIILLDEPADGLSEVSIQKVNFDTFADRIITL